MLPRWTLALVPLAIACAQSPAPAPPAPVKAPPPSDPGVFRLPSAFPEAEAPAKSKEPEAPKKVILDNQGKPIRVPFGCTDDDISAFGMTCTPDDPCAVYLELAAVYGLNSRIFLAGNLHNGSSTMYSVLLVSEDNGKTFQEAAERIRSAGLDRFQFFDNETGWASGGVLTALPRDPFLLLTTDGGRNWRQRPVFSESKPGLIEHFSFESKTAGVMLVDKGQGAEGRFERYESMTGGDTWMVREVSSRPPKLKPAAGPAADWRLQADARLKAHSIERRVGERWERVATFQIKVGECKPTANATPEPETAAEPIADVPTRPVAPEPAIVPRRGPSKPPSLKKRKQ